MNTFERPCHLMSSFIGIESEFLNESQDQHRLYRGFISYDEARAARLLIHGVESLHCVMGKGRLYPIGFAGSRSGVLAWLSYLGSIIESMKIASRFDMSSNGKMKCGFHGIVETCHAISNAWEAYCSYSLAVRPNVDITNMNAGRISLVHDGVIWMESILENLKEGKNPQPELVQMLMDNWCEFMSYISSKLNQFSFEVQNHFQISQQHAIAGTADSSTPSQSPMQYSFSQAFHMGLMRQTSAPPYHNQQGCSSQNQKKEVKEAIDKPTKRRFTL